MVTFCRDTATPVRAEEGLTGALAPGSVEDGVGHWGECHASLSQEEVGLLPWQLATVTMSVCLFVHLSVRLSVCFQMLAIDREGRAVLTEHTCEGVEGEGVRVVVVNVYCPMVDRENVNAERLDYKLMFYSVLQKRCSALEQAGRWVACRTHWSCGTLTHVM